jgi:glycosyltransferase involved in cell wall biosynthesis
LVNKTWVNISPLYKLDSFDYIVLFSYFAILFLLAVYGAYRIKQVIDFWRYRKFVPEPAGHFAEEELPVITVQLPLFNELYVVDRLLKAVTTFDYPREKLEIQVLDDSTDETVKVAEAVVAKYAAQGFDIHYIHRTDRTGFKAGALENGNRTAKGELLAIFDADFVPKPDCLRKLVHFFTDPLVGCAQMRWAHINGNYNLLTRLQTIMLDGHFVVEQTTRNRTGGFFNFNGTAGIWRRQAIEMSGGWQHDTLTEDTDLRLKLYPRISRAPLPFRVKLEMFFRLTGNISYPLMIVASFLQFPLLLVRYNQPFYHLMIFDLPLLFFSSISVVLFYGTAVWYLDDRRTPRLLHLPLVMALGIGLAFSNARAVLEALLGVKTDFIRTPKYRVEDTTDATWKRKKYRRKRGLLPLLELSFAIYFLLAILYSIRLHMWGTIPFLTLFFFGFGYMGLMSLLQTASGKRIAAFWKPIKAR